MQHFGRGFSQIWSPCKMKYNFPNQLAVNAIAITIIIIIIIITAFVLFQTKGYRPWNSVRGKKRQICKTITFLRYLFHAFQNEQHKIVLLFIRNYYLPPCHCRVKLSISWRTKVISSWVQDPRDFQEKQRILTLTFLAPACIYILQSHSWQLGNG